MKRVKARFIGETSCGFVSGFVYELQIYTDSRWVWARDRNSAAKCPYSSIKTLAENWEIPAKGDSRRYRPFRMPVSNHIWDD